MTSPISYSRLVRFLDYANSHTAAPYNASDHDAELDAVVTSIASLITNLAQIQRTDGALKNASVHPDAFTTASKALIGAGSTGNLNWTPRGLWLTATAYTLGNVVQNSTTSYVCAVAHTSGVFATDYAAGKWIILGETFTGAAASITFTPYSHIAATNVQAAIQEVVDEAALLGGSVSQAFSVMDSTTATQAASVGQVQSGSLVACIAGGTSDVITATITSSRTTLSDGQRIQVEATAANGTTAPTFALTYSVGPTATPAKTIKKGNAQPLLVGDIPGLGFKADFMYSLGFDCWLLLNPAFPVGQSAAGLEANSVQNVGLSFSVGSSALTISLKTASGSTPSSSDTVKAALRSSSASTGTFNTRSVTQATNLTVPSGATLGHSSAVEGRLHHYLIDNSGTLELAVSNKFFGYGGIVSTTAISAAATSATVMYSTSARASVPFVWCGYSADTQTTAGTWAGTPTAVDLVPGPRDVVNRQGAIVDGQVLVTQAAQSDGRILTDYVRPPLNINPNFLLDQINEGALYTVNTTGVQGPDGWTGNATGAGVFKLRTLADPDNAARKCLEISCTTADAAIGATDNYNIMTALEGYDVADLSIGTASASSLTVIFKVKSNSVIGTFGLALQNSAANRRYIGTISINAANVEQDVPVIFTLDTSGTWLYTNGAGLKLFLTLAAGSNFQAAAGAWGAGAEQTTSAQANFMSVNTNILYVKRFHVVPGGVAIGYSSQDIRRELAKGQRYYAKSYSQGVVAGTSTDVGARYFVASGTGNQNAGTQYLPVTGRTAGTVTPYSTTGASGNIRNLSGPSDLAASSAVVSDSGFVVSPASYTDQNVYAFQWTDNMRLS